MQELFYFLHMRRNTEKHIAIRERSELTEVMKEKRGIIWRYFTPLNKDQAKCDIYYKRTVLNEVVK